MRKKFLRSRSGFEKPESREEAIMQNILGASNVLEPSESNIEEILKSILYNTPYTKEAEFEIEKILLAIKNNGTYDGEGESRDMKILVAILNGLDYTEEAESRIEELFIEWLNQRSKIKVLEGIPPLTFVAKGEPLINYEISGNMIQSGTPTPDNPIMPEGVGERTANLFDKSQAVFGKEIDGLTYKNNSAYLITGFIPVEGGKTYYKSVTEGSILLYYNADYEETVVQKLYVSGTGYFTIPSGYNYIVLNTLIKNIDEIMINAGSAPLPYEPYGYKIPISSADITTPVYLGEVETTRRIKKLVLTGQEDWVRTYNQRCYYINASTGCPTDYLKQKITTSICSHYQSQNNTASGSNEVEAGHFCFYTGGGYELYIGETTISSAADFKTYLQQQYAAGTPVTVWYVLATSETGIVNEPLMKIGNYADTLSKEQAGVEIPTVNGSNTLDVDTTLKPSNIYIKYK